MYGLECRVTGNLTDYERRAVGRLLSESGLVLEGSPRYTAIAEDGDDNIVATASLDGDVIKMAAVSKELRESGASACVISALASAAAKDGIFHLFLYTKPEAKERFASLGFRLVAASSASVLMECGTPNVSDYRKFLEEERRRNGACASASVMNCNPFTKGHRYLIEEAAQNSRIFYAVVVEEDASVFPFEDRIELVRAGTRDIKNVKVISSSHYAVSYATFPTYFLKDKGELGAAKAEAELDARLFGELFVPSLGVTRRFVGTEPMSPVTAVYNEVLKEVLPSFGCDVCETERKKEEDGVISASRAREAISKGDEKALRRLLPRVTLDYLASPRGRIAASKLRRS